MDVALGVTVSLSVLVVSGMLFLIGRCVLFHWPAVYLVFGVDVFHQFIKTSDNFKD